MSTPISPRALSLHHLKRGKTSAGGKMGGGGGGEDICCPHETILHATSHVIQVFVALTSWTRHRAYIHRSVVLTRPYWTRQYHN